MKYQTWNVPRKVIEDTERAMRGRDHEVFVMWTSALLAESSADRAEVLRAIIPDQKPGQTALGVYVHIDGSELQRVQIENYECRERSIVQLHTHPTSDVRMSELDIEWEVVRHVGALSIIIPNYCRLGLSLFSGANVYEREEFGWRLWDVDETRRRLVLE